MLIALGKSLTDWLHAVGAFLYGLADTMGGPGLMLIALADSSFLSVPEGNDLLIVVLSTGKSWETMGYYVLMTVIGSVIGCSILYWVGRRGGRFMEKKARRQKLEQMRETYSRWGIWAILIPSILPPPTPFKVFVLSAGVFRLPFQKFLLATAAGRTVRYLMWGILAVLYGEVAKEFIEHNLSMVGLILVGFIGLSVVTFMVMKRMNRKGVEPESV
ncbi:MAG: DedA family protein [Acidobacteriota bacterium]|nr:MAG: DedA family protein [Acidobacteriota bacterium]